MQKNEIRKTNKKIRFAMNSDEVKEKSRLASEIFLKSDAYEKSRVLMLYMPLGNETDTSYIITKALSDGKKIVLPVTDIKNTDIIPYYADDTTVFDVGAFSISEPKNTAVANVDDIDTVIVPGIAFSKYGARVGFGKGFYDRFLKKSRAVKIGYCYAYQICDDIIADNHDIPMDYIISECGIIICDNSNREE